MPFPAFFNLDDALRKIEPHLYSAIPENAPAALYDGKAKFYDKVVGSKLYNRLMWGASTNNYKKFAKRALSDCNGPFLDVGSGTAIFTAEGYAKTEQPIVLADRSLGMLKTAKQRILSLTNTKFLEHFTFVHADLFDLPFQDEFFNAVLSMGMFHLFKNDKEFIQAHLKPLKIGGKFYFSSLVANRFLGRKYLSKLQKSDVVAYPRTLKDVRKIIKEVTGNSTIESWREGNMAYFIVQK